MTFQSRVDFLNPGGTTHGGYLSAMLDECMGSAIVGLFHARFMPVTITMSTQFIRSTGPGQLIGLGRVLKSTATTAFMASELTANGDLIAAAQGVYRLLPFPNPTVSGHPPLEG